MGLFSSKKTPTQRTPVEAPNTLRSKSVGRIVFAIGEGHLEGIIGTNQFATGDARKGTGAQNILFGGTPLQNADGTINFPGVDWDFRNGTPDQPWIPGYSAIESIHTGDIGLPLEITRSQPAIRTVTNLNVDFVRITVGVNALIDQNTTTGDTNGSSVDFVIRMRRQGLTGWEASYPINITGKTTGPYEEAYRLGLPGPPGSGPWDIQIERLTPDSDRTTLQNSLNWVSVTDIIEQRLTYPNTALLALTFDAELFGNSLPTVTSRWKCWRVRVPDIYDPVGRSYNGIWQGGYKMAYSDNPAWLFLHLLTHPSGANLPDSMVDRWSLYSAAQYCDGLVPSGMKNSDGSDILEPRFTAHFAINTRQESFAVINSLASCFRAMAYWAGGAIRVVQDAPRDADVLVTPTDTIGGFSYAGSAMRAIHTVALVSFLNGNDQDKPDIEVYEDPELIQRYGWQPAEITAFACKSRGQAYRLGKWLVETEKLGDSLTYKTSVSHLEAQPGDVIKVADKAIAGIRMGGRVVSASTTVVNVDEPVTIESGKTYKLSCTMWDGTVLERNVTNGAGTTTVLTVGSPYSIAPTSESQWVLTASDLSPRLFRMIGIAEEGDLEYTVAATPYDPFIYARVERDIHVTSPPITKLPDAGVVQPPSNVRVDRQYVSTPNGWTTSLELSWDNSPDPFVRGYVVRYQRNDGNFTEVNEKTGNTQTLYGESVGKFVFHVQAVNFVGVFSRPAILEVNISNTSPISLIRPTGLELEGQGNNPIFSGRDPKFVWRGTALRGAFPLGEEPATGAGYLDGIFRDYEFRVLVNNVIVFVGHTGETNYTFTFERNSASPGGPHRAFRAEVYMRDRWGNYSLPAFLEVNNPAPAQPLNLSIEPGIGLVFVTFSKPTDLDYEGTLVWADTQSGFIPGPENLKYNGRDTYLTFQAERNSTVFVRVAAYDSFGMVGLNISAEFVVVVGGADAPDFLPPKVPTGLILSQSSTQGPDGSNIFKLNATWDLNTEDDFLLYNISISENGGGFVFFTTGESTFEWIVQAGSSYTVKLSAVDGNSNRSVYSAEQSLTISGTGIAPQDPIDLRLISSMRTVWLQWSQHPDRDWNHMEIWESSTNNRSAATHIHNGTGTTFAREGLTAKDERWYWIRAVNRSLAKSTNFFPVSETSGIKAVVGQLSGSDFPLAVIEDGFIRSLDASKITAGSVLSGSVVVNGRAIGSITDAVGDPAAAINQAETRIDPGKILISGNTTLSDWRFGGDTTKINGGNIAANTITTNQLTVGNRNVEVVGTAFEVIDAAQSVVRWTVGTVIWPSNTTGIHQSENIIAGQAQWFSSGPNAGTIYMAWTPGSGGILATRDPNINANPNYIVFAMYHGGTQLIANYARTVIHGDNISTGTINANKIQANSITAAQLTVSGTLISNQFQLGSGVVTSAKIADAQILNGHIRDMTFDKLTGGNLLADNVEVGAGLAGYGRLHIQGGNSGWRRFVYVDHQGTERVYIGQVGQTPNLDTDGIYVRDRLGKLIFSANGLGVEIVGTNNIVPGNITGMNSSTTGTVGIRSAAGGKMVVIASGLAQGVGLESQSARLVVNGPHVGGGAVINTATSTSAAPFMTVMGIHQPPIGIDVVFSIQYLDSGAIWRNIANGTVMVIEHKR